MKLIRFQAKQGTRAGVVTAEGVHELPVDRDFADWLSPQGQAAARAYADDAKAGTHRLDQLRLLPPIDSAARIFCVGINYKSHAGETGRTIAPYPSVFTRTQQSVVGHAHQLALPTVSTHYDYEGELAIVIGADGRDIEEDAASGHIAGYTCFNDGSVRDYQKHSVTAGKNFDGSGSCGPWIVTADELGDPHRLTLTTRLNGVEVQHSGTDVLIYSVMNIVSYLSRITELRRGDLIATGTPAGVGARRDPPLWMKAGDTVQVEISGIGVLRNLVAASHQQT